MSDAVNGRFPGGALLIDHRSCSHFDLKESQKNLAKATRKKSLWGELPPQMSGVERVVVKPPEWGRGYASESQKKAGRGVALSTGASTGQMQRSSIRNEQRVSVSSHERHVVAGGLVAAAIVPDSQGGMVIGGPLNGSIMPGSQGGMVIGGPLNGSIMPGDQGGMVIGGPLNGSIMPGGQGGMVIGGPLNGSIMPGSQGGMVIGGPLNGSIMPGRF